jgi:Subtilase family/Bacterial Ig-like domain
MRVAARWPLVTHRQLPAGVGAAMLIALTALFGPPTRVDGGRPTGTLDAARAFVARTTGAAPGDLVLVYQRSVRVPGSDTALWGGKLLNRRTGHIGLAYASADGVGGPELLAAHIDAAQAGLTMFDRKASPGLQAAVTDAMEATPAPEPAPATSLPVAVWLEADAEAAERAVRHRHPEVEWLGGRPASTDLATLRRLRAELWHARHGAFAQAADRFEARVTALGGRVAYASSSAPLVFVDLPASSVPALAVSGRVTSMGLEGSWVPAMAAARGAVDASWASGSRDRGRGVSVGVVEYHNVRPGGDLWGVVKRSHSTSGRLAYTGPGQFDHPTWVAGAVAGHAGSYRGVAPGASIVSSGTGGYYPSVAYDRKIIAAADWAISPGGGDADIVNTSLAQDTATGAEEARRYFDAIVDQGGRLAVSAAGNYVNFNGWQIASPGTGYNVLTVGGVDDRGTPRRRDDRIWYAPGSNGSNWFDRPSDPWNRHGDYNKPNLVAPAVGVRTANSLAASGTSVATPIVAGVAAQVLANEARLAVWPEGFRAVLMAGAVHRVRMPDGSRNVDHEGVGMTSARWSNRVAHMGDGTYGGYRIGVLERGDEPVQPILVRAGDRLRVALAWNSHASGFGKLAKTDTLRADLDLRVVLPDGSDAGSYTLDNAYEFVEVQVRRSGYAELHINQSRFDGLSEAFGLAWAKIGDRTRPSVTLRIPRPGEPWAVASARPKAVFSEAVRGVGPRSFVLRNLDGERIAADVSYTNGSRSVRLRPDAPLRPGRYRAILKSSITDRAGNPLRTIFWRFTVAPARKARTHFPSGRMARLAPGPQAGYRFDDSGQVTGRYRAELREAKRVEVRRRATLAGVPGTWLLVSSGRWSGCWMREAPRSGLRGKAGSQRLAGEPIAVIRAGARTGLRFDGARVRASRTARLDRSVTAHVRERAVINGRRYLRIVDGRFAGYWLAESRAVYLRGARNLLDLEHSPGVQVGRGTWTAYRFRAGGDILGARTLTRWSSSSGRAVAWAVINGRPHLAMVSGPWAGYWLPERNGVRLP